MKLKGRVIHIVANIFYVEVNDKIVECSSRGILKGHNYQPIVGDYVLVEVQNHHGIIFEVVDRKNYLKRPKIANLTQLFLVVSSQNPIPDLWLLDKQLAYAEFLHIHPVIIINKIDLDTEKANAIKEEYESIGYSVLLTNAKECENVANIKKYLENQISVFSGNSGVGKSTLINALFTENTTQEGEISLKNKKGKNTTTSVKLYKIKENSYIADTPGFSNFDVYEIPYRDLSLYFKEFSSYTCNCKFTDCTHIKEASCGVKREVGKSIMYSRYESYQKLYEELKEKEEHKW